MGCQDEHLLSEKDVERYLLGAMQKGVGFGRRPFYPWELVVVPVIGVAVHNSSPMRTDTAGPIDTASADHGICLRVANEHSCDEHSDGKCSDCSQAHWISSLKGLLQMPFTYMNTVVATKFPPTL